MERRKEKLYQYKTKISVSQLCQLTYGHIITVVHDLEGAICISDNIRTDQEMGDSLVVSSKKLNKF